MGIQGNVDRFNGFAGEYDTARPACPGAVVEILSRYLGGCPGTVVDLGCGTGLSTFVWGDVALSVIGVEPNGGMREVGEAKAGSRGITNVAFVHGYSHVTGLEAESADIVTCSQSFHWMEPVSTLGEVARILRPSGVFAAYDCDWPPVAGWELELEYSLLFEGVKAILSRSPGLGDSSSSWDKERHLDNMKASGLFRYCREVVFHSREDCDARRFKGLALSQGGLQSLLKSGCEDIHPYVERFSARVDEIWGGSSRDILFCYRMRLGVK